MEHSRVKRKHLCNMLPSLDTAALSESAAVETDTGMVSKLTASMFLMENRGRKRGMRISAEESQSNQEYVIFIDTLADVGAVSGSRYKKGKMGKKGSP